MVVADGQGLRPRRPQPGIERSRVRGSPTPAGRAGARHRKRRRPRPPAGRRCGRARQRLRRRPDGGARLHRGKARARRQSGGGGRPPSTTTIDVVWSMPRSTTGGRGGLRVARVLAPGGVSWWPSGSSAGQRPRPHRRRGRTCHRLATLGFDDVEVVKRRPDGTNGHRRAHGRLRGTKTRIRVSFSRPGPPAVASRPLPHPHRVHFPTRRRRRRTLPEPNPKFPLTDDTDVITLLCSPQDVVSAEHATTTSCGWAYEDGPLSGRVVR